ncbi:MULTISPECIES: DNA polymerase III subunit epsilon [unclassified Sphingomonas]|jgi:DNA polymerase III subunit epsilon|uniref:DNA polymerase III subunit epsilon n=1 Tax=unclassified Sphingomonas TaxID=196159 RepID=UPI000E105708|nr:MULTISPECIES: DNA polymerase III subunit epsilon [unclassified Sphingomonas]AXJ96906.1 DNA polymerase III subunit epsilon [Sphingomonas sp. FARSPH]
MREIVFDTETTGLSFAGGDRLVEIGCVELVNRVETGRTFHAYYHPERSMPAEAQAVHGISDAFLADKPLFGAMVHELLDFIGDAPLVAHNAGFDFSFINGELSRCGRDPVCTSRMIDTLAIARQRHPGAKHTLDALCSRFGVDRSHRVLHGALLDAQLLAQVYVELMGGRQIGLGLVSEVIADNDATTGARRPSIVRPPRHFAAPPAELAVHAAFVATLDNPLWEVGSPA